jgi:hypothetical protein
MTPEERKTLITQYSDGYRVVAEALAGATDEQLDARPAPGEHGPYTADLWLEIYAAHAHAHAEQILVARGADKQ